MAKKVLEIGLVAFAVVGVMLLRLASAQSGCTSVIIGLAPCLSYITGNTSTPSDSCCSQLADVVKSQPACLCSILNGGASSFGITINQTLALAMPSACKVQTPPVSACNAAGGPPKSTVASPPPATLATPANPAAPSNPSTTTSPPSAAEGGSKATPTSISTGSSNKSASLSLMLSIIFVTVKCIIFAKY